MELDLKTFLIMGTNNNKITGLDAKEYEH